MSRSTVITSGNNASDYGVPDWLEVRARKKPAPPSGATGRSYYARLWPALDEYRSVMNPVFLFDLPAMARARPGERWLIRDGLIPLMWFFRFNPVPGKFDARLSVHADFEEFVPDAWRGQTDLYELFEENRDEITISRGARPDLLLTGLIMPSVCSLAHLEKDIARLKPTFRKSRVRAFLSARYEDVDAFDGTAFYNQFIQTLCRGFGTEIEMLDHGQFLDLGQLAGSVVHEFNEKWLYADSMFTRIALSKGAGLVSRGRRRLRESEFDLICPLFPGVSCGIRKKFRKKFTDYLLDAWVDDSQARSRAYYRSIRSSAHLTLPWPKWFTSWCKEFSVTKAAMKRQ